MNLLRGKLCEVKQLVCNNFSKASGRWYPQPEIIARSCSTHSMTDVSTKLQNLDKNKIAPRYVDSKKINNNTLYELIPFKKEKDGRITMKTNQSLFKDSLKKSEISYEVYEKLTKEERDIYMAHLKAIENRVLTYKDPKTGYTVLTVSQHLYKGKCCGNGCRHCPYNHKNATEEIKKSKKYELSKHRSRPPIPGIHRKTRCIVVDNSALGQEANSSGKLAYCIHVYKQGRRAKHMPHATIGDKILVAIQGQMKKAYVVGANTHVHYRKHGVPSMDTNNIVLLDDEGNPLGNRITSPIPADLLKNRDKVQISKVLALATKYI